MHQVQNYKTYYLWQRGRLHFSSVYYNFGGKLLQLLLIHNNQASNLHLTSCQLFLLTLQKNDVHLYPDYLPFINWWRHSIPIVHYKFYPEKINGIWMRSNESMNNSVYYFLSINNKYCNRIITSARFFFGKSLEETLNLNLKVLKNKQLIKYSLIREELRIMKTVPLVWKRKQLYVFYYSVLAQKCSGQHCPLVANNE